MDLSATKTHGEHEDEEADRLVRPSPKVKPPRRDLRRERTDTEQDPDLKADQTVEGDPDLSLNYKKTALRVLVRHLTSKSDSKRVPAWNKRDKRRVLISPQTLKDQSDLYEPYKDQGEEDSDRSKAQPKPREAPTNPLAEDPEDEKPKLPGSVKQRGKALLDAIDPDQGDRPESYYHNLEKDLAKALEDATDPNKELISWRLEDMGYTTNEEVAEALQAVGYQPKKPEAPKPAPAPEEAKPEPEAKPEEVKPVPEVKPKEPEAKPEVPDLEVPKEPEAKPETSKPQEAPQPEPTPETPEDKTEAIAEVAESSVPEPSTNAPIPELSGVDVEDVTHNSPQFLAFARGQKGVKIGPKDELLFTDISDRGLSAGKKMRAVAFKDLPPESQQAWKDRFYEVGEAEKRVGLVRMLSAQDSETRKLLQDIANPFSELGKTIRAQSDLSGVLSTDAVPGLQGKLSEGLDDLADLVAAAEVVHKPPPPPVKQLTSQESAEAWRLIMDEAPIHMRPMLAGAPLSPQEVRDIIASHKIFEENPPSAAERKRMIAAVKKNGYYLDPRAVPPPEMVDGLPFRSLPPDKQAEAMQAHRMKLFTQSLIVRQAFADDLNRKGLPKFLATVISDYRLGRPRLMKPEKAAQEVYVKALASESQPLGPKRRQEIIDSTSDDPTAAKLATAYLQASDYHAARKKYLQSDSDMAFSERSAPNHVAKGLLRAMRELRVQGRDYPEVSRLQDVAREFRNRVLDRLKALNPEKYAQVNVLLQKAEASEYAHLDKQHQKDIREAEKDQKRYDKEVKKAESLRKKQLAEHRTAIKKWQAEVQAQMSKNNASPYRVQISELVFPEAPQLPDDPVAKVRHPKPKPQPPEKPLSYTKYLSDEEAKAERSRLFPKDASVSSYRTIQVMKRTSVYHGVDPYPSDMKPYPSWTQAKLRDFAAADEALLLASARKWLGSAFLTSNYEGVPKDVRFRAALDLAIHTAKDGAYSEGLPPPLYEDMFRNLAGTSADKLSLTVLESSYIPSKGNIGDKTMTMPKFSSEQANSVLTRLDKLAKNVQANHETWGMPFDVAKSIVNDLDRTADEIEIGAFGKESFEKRQAEVILREADEPYMDTFENPMQPHQTDADEPYMAAYSDDQSSAVNHGKAENGRPLAP